MSCKHPSIHIALLCGGYSEEAAISLAGVDYLLSFLAMEGVQFTKVVIESPQRWFALVEDKPYPIERGDFSFIKDGKKETFDAVHLHIHGTPGEDGKLQNYFELIGIPYLGCMASVSALTFNKELSRLWAMRSGVRCAAGVFLPQGTEVTQSHFPATLSFPMIVKPNEGGSSVGIYLAENEDALFAAVRTLSAKTNIIVEEFIVGREFSVGAYRDETGKVFALPITEIKSQNAFFDYEAKYHKQAQEITPAPIDETLRTRVSDTAKRIYEDFHCSLFVRMDFIWSEEKQELYFLEVNTIPGFSSESILPQQIKASGVNIASIFKAHLGQVLHQHTLKNTLKNEGTLR